MSQKNQNNYINAGNQSLLTLPWGGKPKSWLQKLPAYLMILLPPPCSCQNSFWKHFQIKPPLTCSKSMAFLSPFKQRLAHIISPFKTRSPQRENPIGPLPLLSHCQRQTSQRKFLLSFLLTNYSSKPERCVCLPKVVSVMSYNLDGYSYNLQQLASFNSQESFLTPKWGIT